MKKVIFLFTGIIVAINAFCQERTVDINFGKLLNVSEIKKIAYNGTASDRLIPTTRDTIDYYIQLTNMPATPLHFYVNFTFDTIAGADTTISITVQKKMFNSESYTDLIAASTTSAVTAELQVSKTSLGVTSEYTVTETIASHNLVSAAHTLLTDTTGLAGYPADSISVPAYNIVEAAHTATSTKVVNASLYYGYLKFRLIISGNDSVGTGIKVKRLELTFF